MQLIGRDRGAPHVSDVVLAHDLGEIDSADHIVGVVQHWELH